MQLTKELFIIPNNNSFFLYAPIKGVVMEVNQDMIFLLQQLKKNRLPKHLEEKLSPLIDKEIIVEYEEQTDEKKILKEFKPTSVTIMPTTDCNLRCVYCYANAGIQPADMKKKIAYAALDYVIKNAVEKKEKKIHILFFFYSIRLCYKKCCRKKREKDTYSPPWWR